MRFFRLWFGGKGQGLGVLAFVFIDCLVEFLLYNVS